MDILLQQIELTKQAQRTLHGRRRRSIQSLVVDNRRLPGRQLPIPVPLHPDVRNAATDRLAG